MYLVSHIIKHARSCSSSGTLVVPASFWPLICPDGVHLADFIHSWDCISFYKGLLQPGFSGKNIGHQLPNSVSFS